MPQLGRAPVNDQPGHVGGHQAGQEEAGLFLHGEGVRHSVLLDQACELVGNPGRSVAAEGLVGRRQSQGFARRILHPAGNFAIIGKFLAVLLLFGVGQKAGGQSNRPLSKLVERGVCSRGPWILKCCHTGSLTHAVCLPC